MMQYGKTFLSIFFATVALVFLWYYQSTLNTFLTKKSTIYTTIQTLYEDEMDLRYNIVYTSFLLYQNFDTLNALETKIQKDFSSLYNLLKQERYPHLLGHLEEYKKMSAKRFVLLEKYKQYNGTVKNSLIFLTKFLQNDISSLPSSLQKRFFHIITQFYILRTALDQTTTPQLQKSIKKFIQQFRPTTPKERLLLAHIKTLSTTYPKYHNTFLAITSDDTIELLKKIRQEFASITQKEAKLFDRFFFALVAGYFLAALAIIYFIYRLDRENKNLFRLKEKLEESAVQDDLTKLCNRRAFKNDVRKVKNPFFLLVNINGFKHYNDFYGNKTGDHLLRTVAKALKTLIPAHYNAKFYRLGGDDFGILIDEEFPIDHTQIAQNIITYFQQHPIIFKSVEMYISVSIGCTRKRPLLETADMALKYVKQHNNIDYFLYDESLNFIKQIKRNIQLSKKLKKAIDQNHILPFYQPIVDTKSGKIIKYEALARLKNEDGEYESIFPYLAIAKELKLYKHITTQIAQKSFHIAYKYKKPISINISMQDIEDREMIHFFAEMFKKYPNIASLITFEVVESETLSEYKTVQEFISIVRAQGCQVALDDFGSGYSNFTHIFQFDFDYIKIDGTLIKHLPSDPKARLIVSAIVAIAKKQGIKTVAEYVADQEIFGYVQNLGIDYAQGYYFGMPEAEPIVPPMHKAS